MSMNPFAGMQFGQRRRHLVCVDRPHIRISPYGGAFICFGPGGYGQRQQAHIGKGATPQAAYASWAAPRGPHPYVPTFGRYARGDLLQGLQLHLYPSESLGAGMNVIAGAVTFFVAMVYLSAWAGEFVSHAVWWHAPTAFLACCALAYCVSVVVAAAVTIIRRPR